MKKVASSPERHTFQKEGYIKHCEEEGKEPNPDYVDMYKTWREQDEENLKDPVKRISRRHIISAWNPCQVEEMALPPCHIMMQFDVSQDNYLSCAMYQRSCDVGLGVPFNIASYSFLTHMIAAQCGLVAKEFVYFMGNCHIYMDHLDALKEQIQRTPLSFPKIAIKTVRETIDDYTFDDIEWVEKYQSHGKVSMKMVA